MDFREVDNRYAELRRQYEAGTLGAEEFDARLNEMMTQDTEGRWWAKTRDGEWHYHDGRSWITANPPQTEREPAVSRPPETGQTSAATPTYAPVNDAAAPIPPEIQGWNWGAFLLNWIWAFGNGVPVMGCLSLIPPVSIAMPIVLGIKGNGWAWRNKHWHSVEHFRSTQRKWAWAGLIVNGLFLLLAVLVIVLALVAAAVSGGQSSSDSDVIFEDDFSTTSSRWPTQDNEGGTLEYANGAYRMYNPPSEDGSLFAHPTSSPVEDASVRVDAARVGENPTEPAVWGVICRLDTEQNDFYALGILNDGSPVIGKFEGGEVSVLAEDDPSDAVRTDTSTNSIRGDCVGSTLTLYVNDQQLLETDDTEFDSGRFGLIVDSGANVSFDNFSVSRL